MKKTIGKLTVIATVLAIALLTIKFRADIASFLNLEPRDSEAVAVTDIDDDTSLLVSTAVPYEVLLSTDDIRLGEATRKKTLTIYTVDLAAFDTITKEGLFSWDVFKKTQSVIYRGTGSYSVDLGQLDANRDVIINQTAKTITIYIPEPELSVISDPNRTEFSDTANGVLTWGEMELTLDLSNQLEVEAERKLRQEMESNTNAHKQAEEYACLSVKEIYEPIIRKAMEAAVAAENDVMAVQTPYQIIVQISEGTTP